MRNLHDQLSANIPQLTNELRQHSRREIVSFIGLSAIVMLGFYLAQRAKPSHTFYADAPDRLFRTDGTPRELQCSLVWSTPPKRKPRLRDNLVAAIVTPTRPQTPDDALIRIDSQCFTSTVLGDTSCDCRWQREAAMDRIEKHGNGVLLLLLSGHEGRGHGLATKIDTMALAQQSGTSFSEALSRQGKELDDRDYADGVAILRASPYKTARVLTNNPAKLAAVQQAGIIAIREPLTPPDTALIDPSSSVSNAYHTEWLEK